MSFAVANKERRTEKLDLRISLSAKRRLQEAAEATHRSVSDFVMETALAKAEETLADRRIFRLGAVQWEAFLKALDAPARSMPRMQVLMQTDGFFDSTPVVKKARGKAR